MPPIKPWVPDLVGRIAKVLEGYALSVIDIADILDVSDKTVEAKVKEMRKPEYGDKRVICFIDVTDEECRWVLLKDLEEIVKMEDFEDSFKPRKPSEPFRIQIKSITGGSREIILTPEIAVNRWESVEKTLPEEIYQVKIQPAYGYSIKELTITYYNIPRKALKYIFLNAATILQSRRTSIYY
jgi:ATP-dependent Lhr-like helicase